jgi:hypothetical protein
MLASYIFDSCMYSNNIILWQDDWNDKKFIKVSYLQEKIPASCEGSNHVFPREGAF